MGSLASAVAPDAQATQKHVDHHPPLEDLSDVLKGQRAQYAQALTLIEKRQWHKLGTLKQQLETYPLAPYLDYAELIGTMHIKRRGEITAFLEKNAGSVLAQRLRSTWLNYLAKRAQWSNFLLYYAPEEASTARQCQYQLAKYHRDNRADAMAAGLDLWIEGQSQPRQCDSLFRVLINTGAIQDHHAWQRFNLALLNHNRSLARYTRRFMTQAETRKRADLYYNLDRHPHTVRQVAHRLDESDHATNIMGQALRRLARVNPLEAEKYWPLWKEKLASDPSATAEFISALVKALIKSGNPAEADVYLEEYAQIINQVSAGDLLEWRIRHALRAQQWSDVQLWITRLTPERQQRSEWRYWLIRSLQNLPPVDVDVIQKLAKELAKERDFYGFVISEKLQQPYRYNHHPVSIPPATLKEVAALPALKRARELYSHGMTLEANREWHVATKEFGNNEWLAAATLAARWGWHSRAIIAMAQAKYWDDIVIRFPLVYEKLLSKAAASDRIEPQMLFAIARQESAFERDAVSRAGAVGLLQLMPATAKATAKTFNIPYRGRNQLRAVETNVPIGSRYFKSLVERFHNNRILAAAAYNAGPERVSKWLSKSAGTQPFDIWIELIPFKETRGYVKNVLMYATIYGHRLGAENRILETHEREQLL